MTCGNHDFWEQEDFHKTLDDWRAYSNEGSPLIDKGPDNFHFLYNDSVILDGVKFIGGTMWTDFNGGDPISMASAHRVMNDFAYIKSEGKNITPRFIIREHDLFIDYLISEWEKPFDGKIVVISHHSPGNELRRRGHRTDRVGSAYFADLEQMIGYHDKAHLWVHGHTHQCFDYMINNTRVVCNPYGYHNYQTNGGFDPNLVIEI
jgi:Icc-related predicted phosphoesterase